MLLPKHIQFRQGAQPGRCQTQSQQLSVAEEHLGRPRRRHHRKQGGPAANSLQRKHGCCARHIMLSLWKDTFPRSQRVLQDGQWVHHGTISKPCDTHDEEEPSARAHTELGVPPTSSMESLDTDNRHNQGAYVKQALQQQQRRRNLDSREEHADMCATPQQLTAIELTSIHSGPAWVGQEN